MKKLAAILMLMFMATVCFGQGAVRVVIANFQQQLITNRPCQVSYAGPGFSTNAVAINDIGLFTTDTNGSFIVTNPVIGTYLVKITAPPALTSFYFTVTNLLTNTISVTNITSVSPSTTFPQGYNAYTMSASDARYSPGLVAGTNVVLTTNYSTNQGVVTTTINVNAPGASGLVLNGVSGTAALTATNTPSTSNSVTVITAGQTFIISNTVQTNALTNSAAFQPSSTILSNITSAPLTNLAATNVSSPLTISTIVSNGNNITISNTPTANDSATIVGTSNSVSALSSGLNSVVAGGKSNVIIAAHNSAIISGLRNSVSSDFSIIVGGNSNLAGDVYSIILGGQTNLISVGNSIIIGGISNFINSTNSLIIGGQSNLTTGNGSGILLGANNSAFGDYSIIAGGISNQTSGNYSGILAGNNNVVSAVDSCVVGGFSNAAASARSAIIGGFQNTVSPIKVNAFIIGGSNNTSGGINSGILGGSASGSTGDNSIILGGQSNASAGINSGVFGGSLNSSSGDYSLVLGGQTNTSGGTNTVILGGNQNVTGGGNSVIAGGFQNSISNGGSNNFIIGGISNSISTNGFVNGSGIIGGASNFISSGPLNFIMGGFRNNFNGCAPGRSCIGGGTSNFIGTFSPNTSGNGFLMGGIRNTNYGGGGGVLGGQNNLIGFPMTDGNTNLEPFSSVILGGYSNTIGTNTGLGTPLTNAIAGGVGVTITNNNSFVWNDGATNHASTGDGRFEVYSSGGIYFTGTVYTNGVALAGGGGGGSGTVTSVAGGLDAAGVISSWSSAVTTSGSLTPTFKASIQTLSSNNGVNLTGVVASSVSGTLTNNISGNAANATNFSGSLSGNVTGTQGSTVVSSVGSAALPAVQITGTISLANLPTTIISNMFVGVAIVTNGNNTFSTAFTALGFSPSNAQVTVINTTDSGSLQFLTAMVTNFSATNIAGLLSGPANTANYRVHYILK